jgi:hypothetical protein
MKYFCHSNSCIRCSRSIAGRAEKDDGLLGCLLQSPGHISRSTPSPWHPPKTGGMLNYLEAVVVLIEDILPSISLQINRCRKAFRGHEPRPQPERGRPAGRLVELQKNALMGSLFASTYISDGHKRLKGRYDPYSFRAANSRPCHSSRERKSSGCITQSMHGMLYS